MDKFYAHSLEGRPQREWQSLEEHLNNVAKLAEKYMKSIGLGEWSYIAGKLHDIGKYSKEFQEMLIKSSDNEVNFEPKIGHPDHSTAGAQCVDRLLKEGMGRLIAYAIAGHHSGLPDGKSVDSCLENRLIKKIPDYSLCPQKILGLEYDITDIPLPLEKDRIRLAFQLSFFVRMIFSCLVDADFLDTEEFMDKEKSSSRGGYPSLLIMFSKLQEEFKGLSSQAPKTNINKYRGEILKACLKVASEKPGLFSLTVPTGGGKTLSSLAFALKHAIKNNMQRVIYVIPYTSIIEQNADVFRKIFGDGTVIEHHSNFEPRQEDYKSQLAAENWDAPLIVTTNVQFFDSLFAHKVSRARKIHNIANSVVILDEAQMLPVPLLKPCLEAIKELANSYKTSVVLCSATQPALSKTDDFTNGLQNVREIILDPKALYNAFRRVEIIDLIKEASKTPDDKLVEELLRHKQVLCVVNTRKHARLLYQKIHEKEGFYHLSGLMCPVHRSKVIKEIKQALWEERRCRVISTQLIEAGVDIDFSVVFRSSAGIDSIAQSAGRCNREGKLFSLGKIYIFHPEEGLPIGYLRHSAEVAESVARKFSDLLSLEAIQEYFYQLYWRNQDNLDQDKILELLSAEVGQLRFPFRQIGETFGIIKTSMVPIIIPYNEAARDVIKQLRYADSGKTLARKAQRFCVQLYPNILAKLLSSGAVESIKDKFYVLNNAQLYKDDIGLDDDNPYFRDIEGDIV